MNLVSVYKSRDSIPVLWELLKERTPEQSISHKVMPSFEDHAQFVLDHPYQAWYLIQIGELPVGAIYLSHDNEIGIFVFKTYQGKGYGRAAIRQLMKLHGPRRYLANVGPRNIKSQQMFLGMGFRLVQHTYELEST